MTASTPRLGIDYVVGTDDVAGYPAIAESAANVLDHAIALTQVGAMTNTTATGGQIIAASAGVTVTLPDPTVGSGGSTVGVFAIAGVTGSSPVTVEYGVGGGAIYGVGAAGVSSYLLGTAQATTILLSDGLNWQIISGHRDTGWVPLTLPLLGVTGADEPATPAALLRGDHVELCGTLHGDGSGPVTAGNPLATLPSGTMFPADGETLGIF